MIVADCIQIRDGGYVFVGPCCQNYDNQAMKIDNSGAIAWNVNLYMALPSYVAAKIYCVDTTGDGGIVIAGSGDLNGQNSGFILKMSSNGAINAGGAITIPNASHCGGVRCLKNGNFMLAGGTLTAGNAGGCDIYIACLSSGGTVLHESTFGGSNHESANSLQLTSDGGSIVVGNQNWVIKTDENGAVD